MQCEYEQGEYKDSMERCPNEATEVVLTPHAMLQLCAEHAEEMRQHLVYLVHEVPSSY